MRTCGNNNVTKIASSSSSLSMSETSSARDSSVVSESNSADPEAESLLQRLRAPKPSVLARKRIIKTNPPVGKKRGKGRCEADPKNVTVSDRLKEYSEETFVSSCGRHFCSSCREVVSLKKSVIEHHIVSQKHNRGKERQKRAKMHDQSIYDALEAYDKSIHPVGENLPEAVRVRRVKVVQALLKAGIPLAKSDCLRELFEEDSTALTSSANLR